MSSPMILQRQGILTSVLHDNQFYYLGTLLFAFTLFYAYVEFRAILRRLERQHSRGNLLVSHPRTRLVVVR